MARPRFRAKPKRRTPNLYAALAGDLSSLNSSKTHGEAARGDLFGKPIPNTTNGVKTPKTRL